KRYYRMEDVDLARSYLGAMQREILSCKGEYPGFEVRALDVGGGIAGHVADEELGEVLKSAWDIFSFAPQALLSLRVHPGMVSAATVEMCKRAGIGLLRVDYVTADLFEAEAAGRILPPSAMDVTHMVLKGSGLRLSFDLILGLPGQSERSLSRTLDTVMEYGADEIVLHLLDWRGTPFEEKAALYAESRSPRKSLPQEAQREALLWQASKYLSSQGYRETLPGRFSSGEADVWYSLEIKHTPLLGFGLGAKSRMDGFCSLNTEDMGIYLSGSPDPARLVQVIWQDEKA
ncbi:MAG: hypothetical protein IIZ39_06450, partial [Blautia sp.]|nr:hypothetical protein [Blautia sp.]